MWCKQSSDLSNDGSIETLEDDCVLYLKETIDQDYINSRTKSFDDFNFKNGAIELIILLVQLLRDSSLALVCKITDEIRETFT
jgi:hypothetical protein